MAKNPKDEKKPAPVISPPTTQERADVATLAADAQHREHIKAALQFPEHPIHDDIRRGMETMTAIPPTLLGEAILSQAPETPQPNAEQAEAMLLTDLGALLSPLRADGEGPVQVLRRIIRERDEALKQLQPAHDAFGPGANARGIIVSHVRDAEDDKKTYDVGGRYKVALITVKDGAVTIAGMADIVGGVLSDAMPYGLVRTHVERSIEDFITPEAHRA